MRRRIMNRLIFHIFTKISLLKQTVDEKRAGDVLHWWIIFFYCFDENKMTFIVDFVSIQISLFVLLISSNIRQKEKKRFFTEDSVVDKKLKKSILHLNNEENWWFDLKWRNSFFNFVEKSLILMKMDVTKRNETG
jgi:hypothetical protein